MAGDTRETLIEGWRLRLQYFWIDHRGGVVGMTLCAALAAGLVGVVLLINGFQPRDLSPSPPIAVATEGKIIGFIGGDTKYSTGVFAYFRTHENAYGTARLPFFSGCHNGDRIFLTQWQASGRLRFRVRRPGCSRSLTRAAA
jgi:hypothetical protein